MKKMFSLFVFICVSLCFFCEKADTLPESASPEILQLLEEKVDLNKIILRSPPPRVSSAARIEIEFAEPAVPDHMAGTVLDKNPFSFKPQISGKAQWASRRVLRFTPDAYMPAGEKIEGLLNGKAALGRQRNVNDYSFSFQVAEQEMMDISGGFAPDRSRRNAVVYKAVMTFAQPVDIKQLEKDLSIRGDSRLSFTISAGDSPSKAALTTETILRTNRPKRFQLRLPGKYTASRSAWSHDILLAAADDFRVMTHQDITEPDGTTRVYGFRFSEPVDPDTDLSGYVSVSPRVNYRTGVQGNYLTVRGDFLPGHAYAVEIEKGLPSVYGIPLKEKFTGRFYFENIKPEVRWLSEGIYLPPGNQYKLQFKSVNVRRIHVTVIEIMPQNLGFFLQNNVLADQSASWTSQYSYFEYHDIYRTGKTIHEGWEEITSEQNTWINTELDLSGVFKGKTSSAFIVRLNFGRDDLTGNPVNDFSAVRDGELYFQGDNFYTNPASYGYYYSKGTLNKMLIASETGLTIKKENQGFHVFAVNTSKAAPVSGLKLDLYSQLNEVLETRTTNRDGHARFENDGAYIMGRTDSGIALMKLNHTAWETQKFDISGSLENADGMNVFMYTDRGVHRPGDTIYFSAIIRSEGKTLPASQPALFTVHNPLGQEMLSAKTEAGFNGHIGFPVETRISDPTGDWTARLNIGGKQFSRILKVETVRPNRLKIELDLPSVIREESPRIKGSLHVRHLFGAPASALTGNIEASFDPVPFGAERYRDFHFTSPLQHYQPRFITVWEGGLNEEGRSDFDAAVPESGNIPGALRASLLTIIYERGGIPAEHRANVTIFPYSAYAGIKDIFDYGYTATGQKVSVPVIVVNPEGEALSGRTVKVRHYYNSRHWWYDFDPYDRRDFRTESATFLIEEKQITSGLAPVEADLFIEDQGQHYIEIEETGSGHRTGLFFYASRWGDAAAGRESRERNTLEISADQNVYQSGDKAVLSFESPARGMALLTLEQGEKVIHREWKPLSAGRTSFTVTLTDQMMPNCYASISMIQPHNQNTNDAPMRIYGIKPLYVESENTRLNMSMSAPDELAPKEQFSVKVTNNSRRKASFTLAVVDEGLLDLTAFRTPSPWDHFFRKIRLAVRTMDNYDEILGTLFPDANKMIRIGGGLEALDEEMGKRLDQSKVRRFEPVAIFKGPLSIDPGKTVETEIRMPNYVGSVRVMVIGASGHSYSSLEKTIPVKQPLMVLPTIPRVIRPGDRFDLPVSVFAMDSLIQNVKTTLAVSNNLKVRDAAEYQIIFEKPGEKDISFLVEAGERAGADTITVKAVSGQSTADYTVHLPVSSANPFYTEVLDTMAAEDEPLVLMPQKFGMEGTNRARIAFSRMPDIQMDKRVRELIRYPYGCLEQIISALIPQILLPDMADLANPERQAMISNINTGISELQRFQLRSGFSYWPQSEGRDGHYSDWGSAYLSHLLITAKNAGYHVPPSLYDHWLSDTRQQARKLNTQNYRYQTYRLYLLALDGKPEAGAMNMLRENHAAHMDPLSRVLLSAAYYLSGQRQAAEQIKRAVSTEVNPYRETGGTFGSELRDMALMAMLNIQTDDNQTAGRLLNQAAALYRSRSWHSTQETAFMIMAISAWHKAAPSAAEAVTYTVNIEGAGSQTYTLDHYQSVLNLENAWGKKITISPRGRAPLYVSLMTEGVPLESRIQAGQKGLALARNFYDEDGSPITVDAREQGSPFWIVYTIQSEYGEKVENLALMSVLPAGWEIMSTRLFDDALPPWLVLLNPDRASYTDIRDDRINWFFDLDSRQAVRFAVRINPTFKGQFSLSPVSVESMYSPDFYARIAGGRVAVD